MALQGLRPAARLPAAGRRQGLSAWVPDERLATFYVSPAGEPPHARELARLRILDSLEPRPPEGPVSAPKARPDPASAVASAGAAAGSACMQWPHLGPHGNAIACRRCLIGQRGTNIPRSFCNCKGPWPA